MQDLHLVGFTKDHRHLIFATRKDAKSGSYVVPVDDDLIDAVRQVAERAVSDPGPEPEPEPPAPRVESQLSVREVQARLRNGEDVAAVAAEAGVEPAWVERFAPPIRAEQRRVVDRALTVPLTRARAGESAVPLRRAVAAAMAERDVDFTAEGFENAWSAYLVAGDEWVVTFEFPNRGRTRRLEWTFDLATGTLTTTDRFASQLAFVESASDLPPPDATVGAEPTRPSSPVARGALTSGGLARPGSGRVTTPSTTASSMPPVVRATPERPSRPAPSPRPIDQEPIAERPQPRTPAPVTDLPPRRRDHRTTEPPRTARRAAEPPPPRRPERRPDADGRSLFERSRREARPAPETQRRPLPAVERPSRPDPVPPRRPAPVAAETNATRAFSRRPVAETGERMPVVLDDDRRRGMVVEANPALDNAVTAHPPGRGESVVILRSVVDEEPASEAPEDDFADDRAEEFTDDADESADDVAEELEGELIDEDLADELLDADDLDDEDLDEWVDEVDADDDEFADDVDESDDDVDEHLDEEPHLDDDVAANEEEDDAAVASDARFSITLRVPGDKGDDGSDDEAEPPVERAPIRLLQRVHAAPVAAPEDSTAEPEPEPDPEPELDAEPEPEPEPAPATPRSTVQIRPGSATQARRSVNGRRRPLQAGVDAAPVGEADDAADDATPDDRPTRPRRRRREPLRAR